MFFKFVFMNYQPEIDWEQKKKNWGERWITSWQEKLHGSVPVSEIEVRMQVNKNGILDSDFQISQADHF